MRGSTPVEIPVPTGGWRADAPIHKLPADVLICQPGSVDSLNVFVDVDGLLKPRLGYDLIHDFVPDVAAAQVVHGLPDDPTQARLMGGISWTDVTGSVQIVVATMQFWFAWDGSTFIDITGNPNDSDVRLPTRFAQFGVDPLTKLDVLYGVNGADRNLMRRWVLSSPFQPYTDALVGGGFLLPSIAANDLTVIGNRLVVINVTEAGEHLPQRVRWSNIEDGRSFQQIAFNDLTDGNLGVLLAIRPTSRTSAVIYAQRGQHIITAQQGSDAGAFRFDRLQSTEDGPVAAAPVTAVAIVDMGGLHYFVDTDQHVSACDGQRSQSISQPIDGFLLSANGLSTGPGSAGTLGPTSEDQLPVALYDGRRQKLWFFVCFVGDKGLAKHGLCFDLRRQVWEVPQQFPDGITMAFALLEQMGPTWDNPGISAQSVLSASITAFDTTIPVFDLSRFTNGPLSPTGILGTVQIDDELIAYRGIDPGPPSALVHCIRQYVSGPLSPFTGALPHAIGAPVVQQFSWNTFPYASWDAIPADFERAMFIGTADGKLCRFFNAASDLGAPITWRATWAPLFAGQTNMMSCNTAELLVNPNSSPVHPVGDLFGLRLTGLTTPYDPTPSLIFNTPILSSDKTTWFQPLPKDAAKFANFQTNYMQLALSGVAAENAPWLAGITLYVFYTPRPDRGGGFST